MRTAFFVSGVAVITSLVLLGTGCMSSASITPPSGEIKVNPIINENSGTTSGSTQGGATIDGYESDISSPSQ